MANANAELSKYFSGESRIVLRSELHFASYNPRHITEEAKKTLKRGIKKFGLVGGIIVNSRSGMTVVSGHQRLAVMDELNKYDESTAENDYKLRVDIVDLDEKEEKELLILMNNPNAQGDWDYDALRELIPDIDYKDAGFTEADLSMIGVDYLLKTEGENDIADELAALAAPAREQREVEKAERQEEANRQQALQAEIANQMSHEEKTAHMKDVKRQVREQSIQNAQNMDAYIVLSFDTYEAKMDFCERFGFDGTMKFIKGEDFAERCEVVYD